MSAGLIINDRIKAIREHKGLSASDLARVTGLNQSEISQIESGRKRSPRLDTIQRIARALDVSIDYLSGRYEYDSLDKALAAESLKLYLLDVKLREEQVRALQGVAESNSAPQSIREWGRFISNLAVYESHTGRLSP